MRTYQIISADGHLEIPADRFVAYILRNIEAPRQR